ncbi:MAG: DJ-1/PfpI family protein [Anaerolineae bacterium]|nr:DJ-1/PfpI family protein [Anaerolineae bacterium]
MSGNNGTGRKKRPQSYILIGEGFDEWEVVYFLHKFRMAGLYIKSIGLFNKLVTSRQGVALKTDYALAEHPFDPGDDCVLILPSRGRNAEALRHDARIKTLLENFNRGQGQIVVTESGGNLASDVNEIVTSRPTYQPQMGEQLEEFVETLTNHIAFAY